MVRGKSFEITYQVEWLHKCCQISNSYSKCVFWVGMPQDPLSKIKIMPLLKAKSGYRPVMLCVPIQLACGRSLILSILYVATVAIPHQIAAIYASLRPISNCSSLSLVTIVVALFTGISHVLNTAEELEDFKYPELNLHIRHILMRDSSDQDLLQFLDVCVDHIQDISALNARILVHCVAGVSRSASVCIAYLVKYKHMTLRKAYYHVFNKRPCISPNFGFWRQLVEYEMQIRGEASVELLPLIMGHIPDIMKTDAEYRIKLAWMPELISMFSIHFLIMFVQIISVYIFS